MIYIRICVWKRQQTVLSKQSLLHISKKNNLLKTDFGNTALGHDVLN